MVSGHLSTKSTAPANRRSAPESRFRVSIYTWSSAKARSRWLQSWRQRKNAVSTACYNYTNQPTNRFHFKHNKKAKLRKYLSRDVLLLWQCTAQNATYNGVLEAVCQWSFRKTGTVGKLASQAQNWCLSPSTRGASAGVRGITAGEFLRLCMQKSAI